MINWIEILKTIQCDFTTEYELASAEYQHPVGGKLQVFYEANRSKIRVVWYDCDPICFCKDKDPRLTFCDCDWEAFPDSSSQAKVFTKKQYQEITSPNLFS